MKDIVSLLSEDDCLGHVYRDYPVIPIDKLYYGKYAYRVVFDSRIVTKQDLSEFCIKPREDDSDLTGDFVSMDNISLNKKLSKALSYRNVFRVERKLQDLLDEDSYSYKNRLYKNAVYLRSKKDLDIVLDNFSRKEVSLLTGLTDTDLLLELLDDTMVLETKTKKYFNKYDYKVVFSREPELSTSGFFGLRPHRPRAVPITREDKSLIKSFVKDQASEEEYILRESWETVSVFCDDDIAKGVLPLYRMSDSKMVLKIHKCVIPEI